MSSKYREQWNNAGGNAPEDWDFFPIEKLLVSPKSISVGVMYPGKDSPGGIPLIKVSDVKGGAISRKPDFCISEEVNHKYRRTQLNGNELLITLVGNPGDCVVVTDEMKGWNTARALAVLRLKDPTIRSWLRYVLLSKPAKHLISTRLNTTVQKTLNLKDIKELAIPFPQKYVRDSIVKLASDLESKIFLNCQINQTLEQIAQAIFKSWFVDFEPVKAKIEAKQNDRDPERAAMCAISGKTDEKLDQFPADQLEQLATTAALFPDELVDSKLGLIPKEWEVKPLDKIAHYQNGLALQKFRPENEDDFLPVVKIAQLKKGMADSDEKASPNIKPACIIDNGDVVFSWSGSLMVTVWCGGKAALNQHLFKVTSDSYPKWFYYFWTKYHLAVFQQIAADKAVTMGHIKRSHLKEALCAVPNVDLNVFVLINELVSMQIESRLESVTLAELRDTLLPKLLSGEITVGDTQAKIKELE